MLVIRCLINAVSGLFHMLEGASRDRTVGKLWLCNRHCVPGYDISSSIVSGSGSLELGEVVFHGEKGRKVPSAMDSDSRV